MDKKKILICDDEEGIRESLGLILEDHELVFAKDGLEAIENIKNNNPDIVLLDIKMPKLNGLETLRQIKSEKPQVKVVIITGYKSIEMAKEAVQAGASDYIVKPFESKDILNLVQKA